MAAWGESALPGGREEEGVIRGCSWGGTAINAGGVVPAAPLSNFYI